MQPVPLPEKTWQKLGIDFVIPDYSAPAAKRHRSESSDSSAERKSEKGKKKKTRKKKKSGKHKKKRHETIEVKGEIKTSLTGTEACQIIGPALELDAQARKSMKPMTKEEWEKQQSIVRRVTDPETGRQRLIKGDGEVLEEIVSRERQMEINKQATIEDGLSFQAQAGLLQR